MKVSINDDTNVATLRIEGKVVGPWAAELRERWHDLLAPNRKQVRLDIREVTFVDLAGTKILRDIVRETGADVLADSPLTKHFAEQARSEPRPWPTEES